ncbi:MAG TPA: hypothetical protein PLO47_01990 [Bacillota bacterium]|nr:hypothetical protein [Bacillota bacterium]
MKKFIAIALVVLMLACAFSACGKKDAPIVGEWVAVYMEAEGMKVKCAGFMESKLSVKADNTFTMSMEGEGSQDGKWEKKGDAYTLTVDGDSIDAKIVDGVLSISMDGSALHFSKNPDSFKYPDDVMSIEDIFGQ